MLGNRELILIIIFIICIISIVIVKLYYRKHSESDRDIKIFGRSSNSAFIARKNQEETDQIISQQSPYKNNNYYSMEQNSLYQQQQQSRQNPYEINANNYYNSMTNNIKEGDRMSNARENEEKAVAKKISEEPKEVDQSTKKETYTEIAEEQPKTNDKDLKDLFTIDELIKESKRKSKASTSPKTKKQEEPSAKKEVPSFLTPEEREKIKNNIDNMENEMETAKAKEDLNKSVEAVENQNMREILDNSISPISAPIKSPTTKTTDEPVPELIKDTVAEKIDEIQPQVDQSTKKSTYTEIVDQQPEYVDQPLRKDMFVDTTIEDDEDEYDELDYRKDLAKIADKVKNSKLFNNVKDKLGSVEEEDDPSVDEEFIRNVRAYDEDDGAISSDVMYEPKGPKIETAKDLHIKEVPNADRIQVKINNNDATLKKGDEIIYKYDGDTYSSKVFDILGDDITVRFRGKQITIKPGDVKKIF